MCMLSCAYCGLATLEAQTVFTTAAGSSAVSGTYSLTVSQLATAQQLVSNPQEITKVKREAI